jgi:hydrogenase-4 component F
VLLLLLAIPLAFAFLCLALPAPRWRLVSLVAGGWAHLSVVLWLWRQPVGSSAGAFVGLDPLGELFLTLISVLFAVTCIFFVGYHQKTLVSERVFLACMLLLLFALSLVCISQHLGLLWVAMEFASLAVTPLIYFRLGARALQATWKFLLMNSVGIALALLGIFCIALADLRAGQATSLTINILVAHAARLDPVWLRAGFLLALVGFGTKLGLAPLHSWKPDAYGEAPPPISAIMAGGVTLSALLGILRVFQVCCAAGLAPFAGFWLVTFGLLSIGTAAVFIVRNSDYRRLLAYTSVEHMGVLVVGIGLGLAGSYASMLHALHNTLNKGVLFFLAGFLWRNYRSNQVSDVRGALHRHPVAGIVLLAGLCATCGLPPFGMFFSELGILLAAAARQQWWVVAIFATALAIAFVGVMTAMLPMVFGEPSEPPGLSRRHDAASGADPRWRNGTMLVPAVALALVAFALGAYQPAFVKDALARAAETVVQPSTTQLASSNRVHNPPRGLATAGLDWLDTPAPQGRAMTAQGIALGLGAGQGNKPCKGALIAREPVSAPLQGSDRLSPLVPRALPWADLAQGFALPSLRPGRARALAPEVIP